MKTFLLVLLVCWFDFLDAGTVQDRSVPDGLYPGHYEWFDRPNLKNIQLALQDLKWVAQDLDVMEKQLQTLARQKATIFQAEADLRETVNSEVYAYASSD